MTDHQKHYDLIICIRCHQWSDLVLDTIEAIEHYTDPETTLVTCAVDRNNLALAKTLDARIPGRVFCSTNSWGWGAGLYGLLVESILWLEEHFNYQHFMTVDYDTYFIGHGADHHILNKIDAPDIGVIGAYKKRENRWAAIFRRDEDRIKMMLRRPIPSDYMAGEGVQGGCFLMTRGLIQQLACQGFFERPASTPNEFTGLADDHLILLYMRMVGMRVVPYAADDGMCVEWELTRNAFDLDKEGIKVFHPTKIRAANRNKTVDYQVRNHYRKLRGRPPMKVTKR